MPAARGRRRFVARHYLGMPKRRDIHRIGLLDEWRAQRYDDCDDRRAAGQHEYRDILTCLRVSKRIGECAVFGTNQQDIDHHGRKSALGRKRQDLAHRMGDERHAILRCLKPIAGGFHNSQCWQHFHIGRSHIVADHRIDQFRPRMPNAWRTRQICDDDSKRAVI